MVHFLPCPNTDCKQHPLRSNKFTSRNTLGASEHICNYPRARHSQYLRKPRTKIWEHVLTQQRVFKLSTSPVCVPSSLPKGSPHPIHLWHLQVHPLAHIEVEDVTKGGVCHKHHCVVIHTPVVADGQACGVKGFVTITPGMQRGTNQGRQHEPNETGRGKGRGT
jgi:hypothetical protein